MIRKLLVVAAAIAMPVSALTALSAVVGSGVAGARAPTVTAISCTTGGTITFATGGLSVDGNGTSNKTDTTTAAVTSTGTGCNTPNPVNITAKATKCKAGVTPQTATVSGIPATAPFTVPPAPVCVPNSKNKYPGNELYYGLAWNYATGGSSTIATALKHGIGYDDSGFPLTLLVTAAGTTTINPGGACGAHDAGFQVTGGIKKDTTGAVYTLRLCLSTDSGTNVAGTFVSDLANMVFGPNTHLTTDVVSATVDTSTSTFTIS